MSFFSSIKTAFNIVGLGLFLFIIATNPTVIDKIFNLIKG